MPLLRCSITNLVDKPCRLSAWPRNRNPPGTRQFANLFTNLRCSSASNRSSRYGKNYVQPTKSVVVFQIVIIEDDAAFDPSPIIMAVLLRKYLATH
jgi:hypothetical protein